MSEQKDILIGELGLCEIEMELARNSEQRYILKHRLALERLNFLEKKRKDLLTQIAKHNTVNNK